MDAELNALIDEVSELYHPEQHQVCNSSDEGEEVRKLWPKLRENVPVKEAAPAWPKLGFSITGYAPESSSDRVYDSDKMLDTESDCAPSAVFTSTAGNTQASPRMLQLGNACRRFSPKVISLEKAQMPATVVLGPRAPSPTTLQAPEKSKTRPLIPDSRLASTAQLAPKKRPSPPAAPKREPDLNTATTAAPQTPSSPSFTREHRTEKAVCQGAIREFLARGSGRAAAAPYPLHPTGPRLHFKDLVNTTWPSTAPYPTAEPDVRRLAPAGTRAAAGRVRRPRPQDYPVGALAVPPLQLPPPLFKRGWVARKRIATVEELRRMRRAAKHAEPDDADDEDDSDEGW